MVTYCLTAHVPLRAPAARARAAAPAAPRPPPASVPDAVALGAATAGASGMVVHGAARAWAPRDGDDARGAAIAFDSSFPHAAYNDDADDAAHVLLVDFWHPDLSGAEIDALRAFGDCIERHIARCQERGQPHAATP